MAVIMEKGLAMPGIRDEIKKLCKWYEIHARKLPWRETSDPYSIWISEVMLQQTQVATVIPYYHRFLERFPTLSDLATAPEDQVMKLWAGLGYYSRARNLIKGAKQILEEHQGQFPKDREMILELSGIGPYTAGAILSIAFDLPIPIVDGNVERVFARYYGYRELKKDFYWEKSEEWVKGSQSPRILNQAIMELGATVCTKQSPNCKRCPLQKNCYALQHQLTSELPIKKMRAKTVKLEWFLFILEHEQKIYLEQADEKEWWAGLWNYPRLPIEKKGMKRVLQDYLKKLPDSKSHLPLAPFKHIVTHHQIKVRPVWVVLKKRPPQFKRGKWFSIQERSHLPLSSLSSKCQVMPS